MASVTFQMTVWEAREFIARQPPELLWNHKLVHFSPSEPECEVVLTFHFETDEEAMLWRLKHG